MAREPTDRAPQELAQWHSHQALGYHTPAEVYVGKLAAGIFSGGNEQQQSTGKNVTPNPSIRALAGDYSTDQAVCVNADLDRNSRRDISNS